MRLYLLLISLISTVICNSQVLTINVSDNNFGIDDSNSLIVSHIENIADYKNTSGYAEITVSLSQKKYNFSFIPDSLTYSNSYLVIDDSTSNQYTLYFTPLPLVLIEVDTTIIDNPKVLAHFTYADEKQILTSNIGIELRGGFSQSHPKKTYDIEFWNDTIGDETTNVQFGELRSDDDWILDALYNEPLRIRSYVAHKLWLEIHTLGYIADEPNAKSGADVMYVEMFLNGQYKGLYNLSEQIDKKQLKIKRYNNNIEGELYKGVSWGASTFGNLPSYNNQNRLWSGYEYKYPKEEETTEWENLYQFTDFVINSSDTDFTNNIWAKFDEDNYINYFLFLNLIRATDNTGKNIYLARYKANEPYFYVPWDLDGCFGTIWDGTNANITNDILSNGFINKVIDINPNDISTNIAKKWFNYRKDIFSTQSLSSAISNQYNFLQTNKVYEREALIYSNYLFNNEDLLYTLAWLKNRLRFLDIYFGHSFSTQQKISTIYPNPANNRVYINSSDIVMGEEIKIYNNLGQIVAQEIMDDNYLSIEELKQGLYFVIIGGNSYKLIKK